MILFNPELELGNIYKTPITPGHSTYRFALSSDPKDTFTKNANFTLSKILPGQGFHPWHLTIGAEYIDCSSTIDLTETGMKNLIFVKRLTKDELNSLAKRQFYAELKRKKPNLN